MTEETAAAPQGVFCPWPLPRRGVDFVILGLVLSLVIFGLIMVYSSSFIFAQEKLGDGFGFIRKQLLFAFLGFTALLVAARIDYRFWYHQGYALLASAAVLLMATFIPGLGSRAGGATRWIKLGPLTLQPSELAKFAVLFFVARQLYRKRNDLKRFVPGVLAPLLVPAPIFILLLAQPDFGTVAMLSGVILFMMFIAGVRKRFLAGALAVLLAVGSVLIIIKPYRLSRVTGFLDPWKDPGGKGFQILQSQMGLYNGRFFGVGLGNGKEKLFYLPEAHNDFIFAVIGEELGLLGVIAVVSVFMLFMVRGMQVAWRSWERFGDLYGFILGSAITLALSLQALINMCVVLGLLPTKGLTLPFISYGGSSLVIDLFAVGVLLSIAQGPESTRWEIRDEP